MPGCVLTENGKCHLVFDVLSLMENCGLLITGAFYLGKYESDFHPYRFSFCAIVLGTHVFGLLLKFMYYQFQHPWMVLSLARDCMGKVSKAIISLLGLSFVIGIPIIAYLVSPSQTSTVLYILIGFCSFMVRTRCKNHKKSKNKYWALITNSDVTFVAIISQIDELLTFSCFDFWKFQKFQKKI